MPRAGERLRRIAARFRALAVEMGGVMIKVGQYLSSRLDVLPSEILDELADLQDEVPAEDYTALAALAERELGAPLAAAFASFDQEPLAAASLGQVHRARLRAAAAIAAPGGPIVDVAVKIQRPAIEGIVETDLAALRQVAGWVQRYREVRRRADVPALVAEFARTTREELDYLAEGHNAETLAANLAKHPGVRVPRVDWGHTTRRVLALEDVYAIKITDFDSITAAGIDRAGVARRLFETYLQQIFEDGFFHADPHPGNLFVERTDRPETGGWLLTFVDFGMVGRVPPNLRAGLRELLLAAATRDAARLVRSFQTMGMLLPGANLALLEQAEARFFDVFGGKNVAELQQLREGKMAEFADEFGDLMYEMPFQMPNDLLLLGRTVSMLSGMCTALDPEFNLWAALAPFAEKLMAGEATPLARQALADAGEIARALIALPRKADRVLDKIERDGLSVRMPDVSRQLVRIERGLYRLAGGIIFASLLLGGIQLYLAAHVAFADVLLAGAAVTLVTQLFSRPRRGA